MPAEPFWQTPMSAWDWDHLREFLGQNLLEGQHLEYKAPAYNRQSSKWELTRELIETVVAFANSDDGLLIVGVTEGANRLPGQIVGIDHKDPESALRNFCANAVEPTIQLEMQGITIPVGEPNNGSTVLMVRVRRGLNPPYLMREHGVFVRVEDQDRHATVRDLQALFDRRAELAARQPTPWHEVNSRIFHYVNIYEASKPPVLMVGLTPTFPITPIPLGTGPDASFGEVMRHALGVNAPPFLEPAGISYTPQDDGPASDPAALACAFGDGSIGFRCSLPCMAAGVGSGRSLDLVELWPKLRALLHLESRWARDTCGASGPLHYRLAIGNVSDLILDLSADAKMKIQIPSPLWNPPGVRNRLPSWDRSGEWDRSESEGRLIERELGTLARQLQCWFYEPALPTLRLLFTVT